MNLVEKILSESQEILDNEEEKRQKLEKFVQEVNQLKDSHVSKGMIIQIHFRIPAACELVLIKVPKELQGNGLAKSFLGSFAELGDKYGVILLISPSDTFGSNYNRLKKFYKSFGFVDNKGRNKDFNYMSTLIRYPN